MTKRITKIGNFQGLLFDEALMEMARLKIGDVVSVTIHDGSIVLTPMRPVIAPEKARATAKRLIKKNAGLFQRLS